MIFDAAGNLYGTASSGGTNNHGVIYKLDNTGHETVLHNFSGASDGETPYSGLTIDKAGSLFGTTNLGGAGRYGVVYSRGS